jgi:hypothetical protein
MPSEDWLHTAFSYGFDSGNVLSRIPNLRRWFQERKIGGSYRDVFLEAVKPYLTPASIVLELGPGRGSWSRAILQHIPEGQLYTADFVETRKWLNPERYAGRLTSFRVEDNSFSCFQNDYFDFFWSFGVLCHQNPHNISEILTNCLGKMKRGGIAVHQYADWQKLDQFGWRKGRVPERFKTLPDAEIWWPRNSREQMATVAKLAGWTVVSEDLGLLERDGMICLRRD